MRSQRSAHGPRCGRADAAFSLVELLIAMGLTVAVAATVLALVAPSAGTFQREPEIHDQHQRLRGALEALQRDIAMAGAGMHVGRATGPLSRYLAAVRPHRFGERAPDAAIGVFYRPDTISLLYVPATLAQANVRRVEVAADGTLALEMEPNCGQAMPDRLCGFQVGFRVLLFGRGGQLSLGAVTQVDGQMVYMDGRPPRHGVDPSERPVLAEVAVHVYGHGLDRATGAPRLMHFDGRQTDLPVVDHVADLRFDYFGDPAPPQLLPDVDLASDHGPWTTYGPTPPPVARDVPDLWPAGENCTFAVVDGGHVPRLPRLAAGAAVVLLAPGLVQDGPWCPDESDPDRFDADLLRVRRIRVVLGVEAPAWLRGPAGPFFRRGGTASAGMTQVPDLEIQFDVSPRNLNLQF